MSKYVPTGKPRGRPKGTPDIAPKVRDMAKKILAWWTRGERWKQDMLKMTEKDRGALISRVLELGIKTELPFASNDGGITVRFELNGVRPSPSMMRFTVKEEAPTEIDVTPVRPALPAAEMSPDPQLYRRPEPCPVETTPLAAEEIPPASAEPELSEHEKEQLRLREELARQLGEMDRNPPEPVPLWKAPLW